MLSCCHCLCSKEYDAMTRVTACYPTDGRSDPVAARVRELINWGIHDISRFSSIHEIIAERIRHDIVNDKVNSTAVGIAILGKLLASVSEINMNLSSSLTASILLLIRTKKPEFLKIAGDGIISLVENTNRVSLSQPVHDIVCEYIELLGTSVGDIACQSLAQMLEKTSVEFVPVEKLLAGIKDKIMDSTSARNIVVALAHSVSPLSLPRFAEQLFHFFDEKDLWEDKSFLNSLMVILLSEMKENCSPPFFRLWLEQLPPKTEDNKHCKIIIYVASRLVEELPSEKLLSSSQTDSLLMLFLFILKLPSLKYKNRDAIFDRAFGLAHTIAAHFAESDLARLAHRQIWETLPTEESKTEYSNEQIILIFKFISNFNDGISKILSSKMVNEGLNKVLKFLIAFKHHPEEIYAEILEYLKKLNNLLDFSNIECIIPFLLALQNEIVKKDKMKYELPFHTFILCAMIDVTKKELPNLKEYVLSIVSQRLDSKPPMIEPFSFIKKYIPKYKSSKKDKTPKTIILFKKSEVLSRIDKRKKMQSIDRTISLISNINEEPDGEDFDEDGLIQSDDIPMLIYQQDFSGDDDNTEEVTVKDDRSSKEKKKACSKAVNNLLQF